MFAGQHVRGGEQGDMALFTHPGPLPSQVADIGCRASASCVMEAGLGGDQQPFKVELPLLCFIRDSCPASLYVICIAWCYIGKYSCLFELFDLLIPS